MSYLQRALLYGVMFLSACYIETIAIERILDGPLTRRYARIKTNGRKR